MGVLYELVPIYQSPILGARWIIGIIMLAVIALATPVFMFYRARYPIALSAPWRSFCITVLVVIIIAAQMVNPEAPGNYPCGVFQIMVMTIFVPIGLILSLTGSLRLIFRFISTNAILQQRHVIAATMPPPPAAVAAAVAPAAAAVSSPLTVATSSPVVVTNPTTELTINPTLPVTAPSQPPLHLSLPSAESVTASIVTEGIHEWYLRHVYLVRTSCQVKLFTAVIVVGILLTVLILVFRPPHGACDDQSLVWNQLPFWYTFILAILVVVFAWRLSCYFTRFENDSMCLRTELLLAWTVAVGLFITGFITLVLVPSRREIWHFAMMIGWFLFWVATILFPLVLAFRHWRRQQARVQDVQRVVTLEQLLDIPEAAASFGRFLSLELNAENFVFYQRTKQFSRLINMATPSMTQPPLSPSTSTMTNNPTSTTTGTGGGVGGSGGNTNSHNGTSGGPMSVRAIANMALREAYSIYHTFVGHDAPYSINISSKLRQRLWQSLQMMTTACAAAARTHILTTNTFTSVPTSTTFTGSGGATFSHNNASIVGNHGVMIGNANANTSGAISPHHGSIMMVPTGAISPRRTISGPPTARAGGGGGSGVSGSPLFVGTPAHVPSSPRGGGVGGVGIGNGHGVSEAADILLLSSICSIYDEARGEILKLMSHQSWVRFRSSPMYDRLLDEVKHHIPITVTLDDHLAMTNTTNNNNNNTSNTRSSQMTTMTPPKLQFNTTMTGGGRSVDSGVSPRSPRGTASPRRGDGDGGKSPRVPLTHVANHSPITQLNDIDDLQHHTSHQPTLSHGGGNGNGNGTDSGTMITSPSALLSLQMIHGKSTPDVFHPSVTHTPRGIHMFARHAPHTSTPTPPLVLPSSSSSMATTTAPRSHSSPPGATAMAWSASSSSPPRVIAGAAAGGSGVAFSPSSRSNVRTAIFFPSATGATGTGAAVSSMVPPIVTPIPLSSLVVMSPSRRTQGHHASFSSLASDAMVPTTTTTATGGTTMVNVSASTTNPNHGHGNGGTNMIVNQSSMSALLLGSVASISVPTMITTTTTNSHNPTTNPNNTNNNNHNDNATASGNLSSRVRLPPTHPPGVPFDMDSPM